MCASNQNGQAEHHKSCKYHSVAALCFARSQSASERPWEPSGDWRENLSWEINAIPGRRNSINKGPEARD